MDELGDGAVEELVALAPRLQHVVVDAPERHRPQHRVGRGAIRPVAPSDQEAAFRAGMEGADANQEIGAGGPRHPLIGKHDRHLGALGQESLEGRQGVFSGVAADDSVIGAEAAAELALDAREGLRLVVDREDDGAGRRAVPGRPHLFAELPGLAAAAAIWARVGPPAG